MNKVILAAVLSAAVFTGQAHAQFKTGNDLVEGIKAIEQAVKPEFNPVAQQKSSFLMGYISGVADAYVGTDWCPSGRVTVSQIMSVVARYLDANPNKWGMAGAWIVYTALKESFPCAQYRK